MVDTLSIFVALISTDAVLNNSRSLRTDFSLASLSAGT